MAPPLGYPKTKKLSFRGLRPTDRPTRGSAQKCVNNITRLLLPASVYIYCLIVPHRNCMRKKCTWYHFSLQKWRKIGDFKVDFLKIFQGRSHLKIFLGTMPPDLHTGEGLRRPTDPLRLGASRLEASLGTFGPSIVRHYSSSKFANTPLHGEHVDVVAGYAW